MLPDDVYRNRLAEAGARLATLLEPLGPAAHVTLETTAATLRLVLVPHQHGACPLELLLRADQRADIDVAGLVHGDVAVPEPADLERMVAAVLRGDVATDTARSAATGRRLGFRTRIRLGGGEVWVADRGPVWSGVWSGLWSGADPADGVVVSTLTYLPYRRTPP